MSGRKRKAAPSASASEGASKKKEKVEEAADSSSMAIRAAAFLKAKANAANAAGAEKYFKHVVKMHGITAPEQKVLFREYFDREVKPIPPKAQVQLAYELYKSKYFEEKALGNFILQKNLKHIVLSDLEPLIDQHVYDWGTCDSLSGKVLHDLILKEHVQPQAIAVWKDAPTLWRQRASSAFPVVNSVISYPKESVVKNQERFAQLGCGWMLRELSLADQPRVVRFIKDHYHHFSREGLRYAIEKMPNALRTELLNHKAG